MFCFVAPAGSPIKISQALRSLNALISPNRAALECRENFTAHLGIPYVHAASSGRAALWTILRALHQLRPTRSIVALPAYTCFTVPAAIARSGLKIHPVDIDPATLDFNLTELEALPGNELLCIISASLFGFVGDFRRINEIARARGAFVIDGAAQALGSARGGAPAGTLGDVGMYSFGRGKMLAAIEGGMIVTGSHEIDQAIRGLGNLPKSSTPHECRLALEFIMYSLFLRPYLYWIPNSLPFLGLGATEFSPDFVGSEMPRVVHGLLPQLLPHLAADGAERQRKAALLESALADMPLFQLPRPAPDCTPNYVRFPVVAREPEVRDRAIRRLQENGIGASSYYPSAVCDIPGIEPHLASRAAHQPAAENLSRRLLTLPTHRFVHESDVKRMIRILKTL